MIGRLKIVVPSFNSVDYLPRTLTSIETQSLKDFDVCVVDDGSTMPQQKKIIEEFCQRNQWQTLFFAKNQGALHSLIEGIKALDCQDGDVIAVIDGDDWLAHNDVLQYIFNLYRDRDLYLTWGQCEAWPVKHHAVKYAQTIPETVIQEKLYREIPFVFWHLVTFKYDLWRRIRESDLLDEDGSYLKVMKDKATLFPMLEMAGAKIHFVSETLYVYNLENPLNDFANTLPDEHSRVDRWIRAHAKYETLAQCQ